MVAAQNTLTLALIELFEGLTGAEVRALMLRVGPRALLELPHRSASHAELAQRAAELVAAYGALDGELLRALLELRPRSRPAISALAAAAGLAEPPLPRAPAARRGLGIAAGVGGVCLCASAIYASLDRSRGQDAVQERDSDPTSDAPALKVVDPPAREAPVAPAAPAPDEPQTQVRPAAASTTRARTREGSQPTAPPDLRVQPPTSAPTVQERWTVARVDGKRLTLEGGALPARGLLALLGPPDGRRFVSEVTCRIEEAPGTCWLIVLPGNDLPRVGDVFVRAPAEDR